MDQLYVIVSLQNPAEPAHYFKSRSYGYTRDIRKAKLYPLLHEAVCDYQNALDPRPLSHLRDPAKESFIYQVGNPILFIMPKTSGKFYAAYVSGHTYVYAFSTLEERNDYVRDTSGAFCLDDIYSPSPIL